MVAVVVVAVVTPTSGIDWLSWERSAVVECSLGGSMSDALDDLCLLLSIKVCQWQCSIYLRQRYELDIRVRQWTSALSR